MLFMFELINTWKLVKKLKPYLVLAIIRVNLKRTLSVSAIPAKIPLLNYGRQ